MELITAMHQEWLNWKKHEHERAKHELHINTKENEPDYFDYLREWQDPEVSLPISTNSLWF